MAFSVQFSGDKIAESFNFDRLHSIFFRPRISKNSAKGCGDVALSDANCASVHCHGFPRHRNVIIVADFRSQPMGGWNVRTSRESRIS
jgi:hypothetical protein